jgi:3D (Asp-Asp-Asp) domain-containing protein
MTSDARKQLRKRETSQCETPTGPHKLSALVGSRPVRGDSISRLLALGACAVVGASIALPASGAGTPASLREQAQQLRQSNSAIASRSRSAVLTLYGLDSRLGRVRAQLASLRAQAARIERKRMQTRRELGVARHVFSVSQRNLAERLRSLYEQGDADPLAIVLGAKSLDDALSALETANAAAATDRHIVAQARKARAAYLALQRKLTLRAKRVQTLEASASATASALIAAKAARVSYLHRLAAERSLNTGQIGSLESRAQSIEARARQIAVQQVASVETAPPAATTTAPAGARTLTVSATAYTLQGTTATGAPVGYGVVAVDPYVIPLGTRMTIPGYGEGIAADTGGAVQGAAIDLWFPSEAAAAAWGRRTVTITLH